MMARSSWCWTRASMPLLAVTGEFTWRPEVLVIPEHAVEPPGSKHRKNNEVLESPPVKDVAGCRVGVVTCEGYCLLSRT